MRRLLKKGSLARAQPPLQHLHFLWWRRRRRCNVLKDIVKRGSNDYRECLTRPFSPKQMRACGGCTAVGNNGRDAGAVAGLGSHESDPARRARTGCGSWDWSGGRCSWSSVAAERNWLVDGSTSDDLREAKRWINCAIGTRHGQGAAHTIEIVLPEGPRIRFLTSTSVFPDVATEPMNMMRSPTCKCRRAFPVADRLETSNPPAGEGMIDAPIPVIADICGWSRQLAQDLLGQSQMRALASSGLNDESDDN
jgi:hypothetical protein